MREHKMIKAMRCNGLEIGVAHVMDCQYVRIWMVVEK